MVKYMKNIKGKIILSILMCILMMGCIVSIPIFAKENSSKKFEYSIRPGTEEWGKLNHGERVLTSQIPQEILENMNTEDLVTAVLDYPCFLDMMFSENILMVCKNCFQGKMLQHVCLTNIGNKALWN